jgi:hypothetical protein
MQRERRATSCASAALSYDSYNIMARWQRSRPHITPTTNVDSVTVPLWSPITNRQLSTTFCKGRRNAVARNM